MKSVRPVCGLVAALGLLVGTQSTARDAVDIAAEQIDAKPAKTYLLGTNGPKQFDCSGLTWFAFGSVGIELPLQAASQAAGGPGALIPSPSLTDLRRGDLLFFDTFDDDNVTAVTHVGVYEGNGKMLNAVSEEFDLRRSDLTSAYWLPRLLSARRLPSTSGVPSSKFSLGDRVEVTDDGVAVRRLRQQTFLGSRKAGDKGRVDFGPVLQSRGGTAYWWWRVNFDSGTDGWVAESFLEKVSTSNLVTYTFSGFVTAFWFSDSSFWSVRGFNVNIGTPFTGRLTYDRSITGIRTAPGFPDFYYYEGALRSFEVTLAGNQTFRIDPPGNMNHEQVWTGSELFPPQDYMQIFGYGSRNGYQIAGALFLHSTHRFLSASPPLPLALPTVSQLDFWADRTLRIVAYDPGGQIRGQLTSLTRQ